MEHDTDLHEHLQALNDLLRRERLAITGLHMQRLAELQHEKTSILAAIDKAKMPIDKACSDLVAKIQANNLRNSRLLEAGLTLVHKMQKNVMGRLALTYAPRGQSLCIDRGPRIMNHRF